LVFQKSATQANKGPFTPFAEKGKENLSGFLIFEFRAGGGAGDTGAFRGARDIFMRRIPRRRKI
jgi:hypothetical protein